MASVRLEHVSKRFGAVSAVEDVTLTINDHEFLVLLGPSGCGKTTTLRMVAGLEESTSGAIYIGDQDVSQAAPKDRDIAMVFQNYALYPHMTVYDNMAFGLKLHGVPRDAIAKRVGDAAEMLGLQNLLKRRPKELSGGQRQRVALGRAIVRDPAAFLMDEPLSNLDAQLRTQTRVELKRLHQRLGTTTLYVTHDQTEAMTLGTRIVVMKDGVVQQAASPDDIYHRPANQFVATFVGTPPMNLMPVHLERRDGAVYAAIEGQRLAVPQRVLGALAGIQVEKTTLGIRPEDLTVSRDVGDGGLQAVVRVIEPMGHETLVYGDIGSTSVIARTSNAWTGRVGETVSLTLDERRWHLFDGVSGASLLSD